MDKRKEANLLVREKISTALFHLMETKPFSRITVSEIVRTAGVARVSFYRNFSCKEDVVRASLSELLDAVRKLVQENSAPHSYARLLEFWESISEQKALLSQFCTPELSELLLECIARSGARAEGEAAKGDYYVCAYLGALYNTLRRWLRGGCRETPEAMAALFAGLWKPLAAPVPS